MAAIPPFRFEEIENNVYRGAYPTLRNFPFLLPLKLRTIISLIPEKPTSDLKKFAEKIGAKIIWKKVPKYKEAIALTPEGITDLVESLISLDSLPVYIHCIDGLHVTGLVVMCLRKLMHWRVDKIKAEFARFVPERNVPPAESRFLSAFDGGSAGLLLPKAIPKWLFKGNRISRHPTIKLVTRRERQERLDSKAVEDIDVMRTVSIQHTEPSLSTVFFVDPVATANPNSVAMFDTLFVSPKNLWGCTTRTVMPHQLGSEHDVSPRSGSPSIASTNLGAAVAAAPDAEQNSRYYPCPYVTDQLREDGPSGHVTATLRALALEGLTTTPAWMAFSQ
uniref:Tyrosine phosphatase n=1 Tax=Lotharella oceanica TaxID=641309 RepID=A0A7S2TEA3_9EUKA